MFHIDYHQDPSQFISPIYKRSWNHKELLEIFPDKGIKVLDVGAGVNLFQGRKLDTVISVDFDAQTEQTVICDFTKEWPFENEQFDFIYASHVIEHLYPQDRDRLIMNIYKSLKKGGMLFVRVPHWSSMQGTGWEHYSLYGTNGLSSLCHGQNPYLPQMDMIATGVSMGAINDFYMPRSLKQSVIEKILNNSFRFTDTYLCYLVGGISEVQFLLRKNDEE